MPATAGRVRMPADNRLSVSASLKTSKIWQNSVKYDPYAPIDQEEGALETAEKSEKAKSLFALARLTGASSAVTPGSCRKCGQVGHLSFQCRNTIPLKRKKLKEDEVNGSVTLAARQAGLAKGSESDAERDRQKLNNLLGLDHSESSSNQSSSSSSDSSSSDDSDSSDERSRRKRRARRREIREKRHRRRHKDDKRVVKRSSHKHRRSSKRSRH